MDERTLFAEAVGVVALRDNDHLRMVAQAGLDFFSEGRIGEEEKLHLSLAHPDERQGFGREDRIGIRLTGPQIGIYNVLDARFSLLSGGKLTPRIHIIGQRRTKMRIAVETRGDNNGRMRATDIAHSDRGAPIRRNVVEAGKGATGNKRMAGALHNVGGQLIGHRNFCLGGLTQRYANRIANAVGQECTYAGSALDAAVLALAGFRHAQV